MALLTRLPERLAEIWQPRRGPAADAWMDHISLVPALHEDQALDGRSPLTFLGSPPVVRTWREAVARHRDLGLPGVLLTRRIIRAETNGLLILHLRQPRPTLAAADFLCRSGLLTPEQGRALFSGQAPEAPVNMWRLSRDLVQRRWLDGVHAGFLNRLGQLSHWQAGSPPALRQRRHSSF